MNRIRTVRGRLVVLMVGALLGTSAGLAHFMIWPPAYSATAVCLVSASDATDPVDTLGGIRWAQALSRLSTQDQIVVEPLQRAGLNDMAANPREYISAVAAPDTSVFTVTVRDPQRDRALQGGQVVTQALQNFADQNQVPVQVSTGGAAVGLSASPSLRTRVVVGMTAALGVAAIIVLSLLDTRRWPAPAPAAGKPGVST